MYNFSDSEIREQVLQRMRELDIYPARDFNLILDGELHRYTIEGDTPSSKNGAYCIFTDGIPAGYLQNWKNGVKENWRFNTSNFPKEQRDYFNSREYWEETEKKRIAREKALKEKQLKASEMARTMYEQLEAEPYGHPYLKKKDVEPYDLKLNNASNVLAVPLRDINRKFLSLQWIDAEGNKKFFTDAPVKGAFWSIALDTIEKHNTILLGEGYATMAKIYELTQLPCVAAMNCHNLLDTARALKSKYPESVLIIMADDDRETEQKRGFNPGKAAADEVVKARVAKTFLPPPFKNGDSGTDWDDFALKYGNDITAHILKQQISYACLNGEQQRVLSQVEQINAQTLRSKIFAPPKWAVQDFIPVGLSILAGGPKVGKSILSLHLSLAIALGGYAFGKIKVEQGDVLYLALEDTQRRLQDRIEGSEISESDDISRLTLATRVPRQHVGGLEYIRWWLGIHKNARLIIIDTLQQFRKILQGKNNIYGEDYAAVSEIKQLADEFDVAFLVIHHLKKAGSDDWLNEISGSQGIAGAADTIFSLKRARTKEKGILHRTGRDVEEKDFAMSLEGFRWILEGDAALLTMPDWQVKIVEYLEAQATDVSPIQLIDILPTPKGGGF